MPFYDSLAKINSNRRARPILVITYTSIFSKNFCDFLPDTNDELNEIFAEFEQSFHEALEDPTTFKNRELLNEQEKVTIEQFKNGVIELNQQYARILIEIISKLQRSFTKIEIGHDEMMKIFSRPMTKQQALDALTAYIDNQSRGHKPEDVRIIIK